MFNEVWTCVVCCKFSALEASKKIYLRRIMIARRVGMNTFIFHIIVLTSWKRSILAWVMFFKPEKRVLFIAFDFSFSYTPNCTVLRFNFQKFSGEGLTEPRSQTPPPAFSRTLPSVRVSPSFSGASRPRLRLRPRIRPPRSRPGSALALKPSLVFSSPRYRVLRNV